MKCQHCDKPLQISQYKQNDTWKSCPKCSQDNGHVHIFHQYPEMFGTTPHRSSPQHPEGAQSYCTCCRGDKVADLSRARKCDQI